MVDDNRAKGGYELETLLLSHYNVEPWKQATEAQIAEAHTIEPAVLAERCRLDAWASAVLVDHYRTQLGPRQEPLITFTHQTAMTIHRIALAGTYVDLRTFRDLSQRIRTDLERAKAELTIAALRTGMPEFQPTRDADLRELLYERLGLTAIQKTRTGMPAVDKVSLQPYADDPTVALLLRFNKLDKLASTFCGVSDEDPKGIVPLLRELGEIDGVPVAWLPVRINPLGARTGRRSSGSSDPRKRDSVNMQNWTKGDKQGDLNMRALLRSRFAGGKIGDFDYSKLEPVLLAWLAQDEKLLDYFTVGGGYCAVGQELFGKRVEDGTREYTLTKSTVLAVHYNAGAWKLAWQLWHQLGIHLKPKWPEHVDAAGELITTYKKQFPGVARFIRFAREELRRNQAVTSATGRVRHLPHRGEPDREDRTAWKHWKHLWNEAVNFPVQSLASDVTGSALIDVERELCRVNGLSLDEWHWALLEEKQKRAEGRSEALPVSRLINEVHDDLVLDLHPDHVKRDRELVIETMRAVPTLRRLLPGFDVPLTVGVKVGPAWGLGE
jgi:DNA polymerase-1